MKINQKDITIKGNDFPAQVWRQDSEERPVFDEKLSLTQMALHPTGLPYLVAGAIVGDRFIFGDVDVSVTLAPLGMNLRFIKERSLTVSIHEIGTPVVVNKTAVDWLDLVIDRAFALIVASCQNVPDLEVNDNKGIINIGIKKSNIALYPVSTFSFPNVDANYFVSGFHLDKGQVSASLENCGIEIERFELELAWYEHGTRNYSLSPQGSYTPITTIIEGVPTGQVEWCIEL